MQLVSENHHFEDSYFVAVHPLAYVVIGILVLVSVVAIIALKNRKK